MGEEAEAGGPGAPQAEVRAPQPEVRAPQAEAREESQAEAPEAPQAEVREAPQAEVQEVESGCRRRLPQPHRTSSRSGSRRS